MAKLPAGIPEDRRHLVRTPSSDFTFKKFGRQTYLRRSTPTIGTTPVIILPNDPNRLFYFVMNRSSVNIEIDWVEDITFGNSLLIIANGGSIQQNIEDDGDVVAWSVYGVAALAGSNIFIMEILGR